MTPKAQRIALAEWLGAQWYDDVPDSAVGPNPPLWPKRILAFVKPKYSQIIIPLADRDWGEGLLDIPDYLNDLDAVHKVEEKLAYDQLPFYITILKNPVLMKDEGVSDFDIVHATAAQRVEALLRTLELWEEET